MRPTHAIAAIATATLLHGLAYAQDETPKIPADKDPITRDSGLIVSMLEAGDPTADAPKLGDRVTVHYTGWLPDGKVFDSSRQRGTPATFALGQVIPGWNEGLQLMTVGGRAKLTIPPDLGYGAAGAPPTIPPAATLIFDVELLGVERCPDYAAVDADKATKTDSGLVYQVVEAGKGDTPAADTGLELRFTIWNKEGKFVHDSNHMGTTRRAPASQLRLGVLAEAAKLMKPGAVWVCDVPATLAFGDRAVSPDLPGGVNSIWRLELTRVFDKPEFAMPKDDDLVKTDSGLRYQVLQEGKGRSPSMGEPVTVHYSGWLTDGTLFDSSYDRGVAATFQLGAVIRGWNEALQLMKPGSIFILVIPAELGYGASGSPPKIGPDETLVFRVELLHAGR